MIEWLKALFTPDAAPGSAKERRRAEEEEEEEIEELIAIDII